ncbi:TetR/AcrR family transcriptional regulator [Nocardia sp. NPDC056100]|uniref:TetR/AcrR family transcriptional regulator n=1 Tax=Nocardia sp. NPDC056100 TaxID=3345712 RepID=UPI0035D8DFFE
MPPTQRRPTDDELLDAACAVFAEHGYRAASMDAIARRANSTKPTLYAHFGSKPELFRRLFRREAEVMQATLLPVYETLPGRELSDMVQAALGAGLRYGEEHPHGAAVVGAVMNGDGPDPELGHGLLDTLIDAIASVVEDTLRRNNRDPGPLGPVLAALMWGSAIEASRVAHRVEITGPELVDWITTYTIGGLQATLARSLADRRRTIDAASENGAAPA